MELNSTGMNNLISNTNEERNSFVQLRFYVYHRVIPF